MLEFIKPYLDYLLLAAVGCAAVALIGVALYVNHLRHDNATLKTTANMAVAANGQFKTVAVAQAAQTTANDDAIQEVHINVVTRTLTLTQIKKGVDNVATQTDLTTCAPGLAAALDGLRHTPADLSALPGADNGK